MARTPSAWVSSISLPEVASSTTGCTPKNGFVAAPGLVAVAPGRGVIMCPPVSVCRQVSTMGSFPLPTLSLYQFQASGLIGSPTVPSTLSDERSEPSTNFVPCPMSARIAVGAV